MNSVLYLVRSPREMISPFLYPKTKDVTVIAVEQTPVAGRIVESMPGCSKEKGATLSYSELLAVIIENQQVITL